MRSGLGAAAPWLLLLVLFYALPLAGLVILSFTSPAGDDGEGAAGFTLANYAAVAAPEIGRLGVLLRTLLTGVVVVAISTLIATPVAYFLAKITRSSRTETAVLMVVASIFLVGPLIRTVSWRGILGVQGLINKTLGALGLIDQPILGLLYSDVSVLLSLTYNAFPFMLFTVYLAMKAIDPAVLLAARDVGARPTTAFRRILLPLAAPGFVAGAILVFVPVMSAVLEPEILGGPSARMTPTAIRSQFFHAHNWGVGAALTLSLLVGGAATLAALAGFFGAATIGARRFHLGWLAYLVRTRRTPFLPDGWVGRAMTIFLVLFAVIPLATIAAFSFNTSQFYAFPITGLTLEWYQHLFANERIWTALANSVGIALAVTVVATAIGTAFAFTVVRGRFPGRRVVTVVGFLPLVTPVLVLAAGLQVAFVTLDLPLGYGTVVLGHTIYVTPFVVLMVVAQLYRYDRRLDAAARDLGASAVATLRRVTLPLLWPSIRAGALLAFLLSFNEWAIAFFTGRGFNTLPMVIYSMQRTGLPPAVLAYSALIVAFVLGVMLFLMPFVTRMVQGVRYDAA